MVLFCFIGVNLIFIFSGLSFSSDKIPTKIIVRVISKDAKVIGSGVGGALVRIRNLETGEILAAGKTGGRNRRYGSDHGSTTEEGRDSLRDTGCRPLSGGDTPGQAHTG